MGLTSEGGDRRCEFGESGVKIAAGRTGRAVAGEGWATG